jgi:hypothetical protein
MVEYSIKKDTNMALGENNEVSPQVRNKGKEIHTRPSGTHLFAY